MSETAGDEPIRRRIGRNFESLRRRAGLSQVESARRLGRSRATIIRMEAGDESVRFKESETEAMLTLYGASAQESRLLMGLTDETRSNRRKGWWHDFTDTALTTSAHLFIEMEKSARVVSHYQSAVMPGLLQTRPYAEVILRTFAKIIPMGEVEHRVDIRIGRQAVLDQPRSPHFKFILSESVLRRPVGGRQVMADQLQHLLDASRRTNVSLRVLPFTIGEHDGLAGDFIAYDFPVDARTGQSLEPDTVYIETLTGAMHLNKPAELVAYRVAWTNLTEQALTEDQSREMISAAIAAPAPRRLDGRSPRKGL